MKLRRRGQQVQEGVRPTWTPIPFWPWTLAAFAAVVIVAVLVTFALMAIANHANPGTDRANALLDAVRTGLAAGAGAGAAVGLILAFRRQHHQEITTVLTDLDATERRITELYAKAVEQLGSDKAPVRLGGLYALERLAQDNPAHRQTIVDVICAYLRMPFSACVTPASNLKLEAAGNAGGRSAQPEGMTDGNGDAWQQERQVRLTAQRLLAEHLRLTRLPAMLSTSRGSRLWPNMRLDLTGATLMDFDFDHIVAADARFDRASFTDGAWFAEATFTNFVSFAGATFHGSTVFSRANFNLGALFSHATFTGQAWFSQARFGHDTDFNDATFDSDTTFYCTIFDGLAEFQHVKFGDDVMFSDTTFGSAAWFTQTTFAGRAQFGRVTFSDDTPFHAATFGGVTDFTEATFADGRDKLPFKETHVLSPSSNDVWPMGWRPTADRKGGHLLARAKATGN
jgi:hypothetical protein